MRFIFSVLLTITVIQLSSYFSFSQEIDALSKIGHSPQIPGTPEASAIGKFGQYEVNLAYGVPQINIPLFVLKSGDSQLPISLGYHAGGNKVSDPGSWIGLGWAIEQSYSISRSVRGLVDEKATLSFMDGVASTNWIGGNIAEGDYNKLAQVHQGSYDTQPDVFSYSIPGYSGTFILDNTGEPFLIPSQPLKVIMTMPCSGNSQCKIENFIIIDPNGNKYFFNEQEEIETAVGRSNTAVNYVSTWYITSIEYANLQESFYFQYSNLGVRNFPFEKMEQLSLTSENNIVYTVESSKSTISSMKILNEKRLAKVISNHSYATFNTNEILQYGRVNNSWVLENRVTLDIGEFAQRGDCTNEVCKRKKLNKVTVNDDQYTLEYDAQALPPYGSFDVDHWGYYNNAGNTSLLPDVKVYNTYYGNGANREVNPVAAQMGILKKIYFPTGGYSEFTYESNVYQEIGSNGMVKKDIKKEYNYSLNGSTPSASHQVWNWPPNPEHFFQNVDEPLPASEITWYGEAEVFMEIGTKIKTFEDETTFEAHEYTHEPSFIFNVNGSNKAIGNYDGYSYRYYDPNKNLEIRTNKYSAYIFNYNYNGATTLSGYVDLATSMYPENYIKLKITRNGYYYKVPGPDDFKLAGGLRIKNIRSYSNGGDVLEKEYLYVQPTSISDLRPSNLSSFVTINFNIDDLKYLDAYKTNYTVDVDHLNNLSAYSPCPRPTSIHKMEIFANAQGRMGGGYPVGYTHVYEISKGLENGAKLNSYSIVPDQLGGGYPSKPAISKSYFSGELVNSKYLNSNYQTIQEERYQYDYWVSSTKVKSLLVSQNRVFPFAYEFMEGCGVPSPYPGVPRYVYAYVEHFAQTKRKAKLKEVYQYANNQVLNSSREEYTFTDDDYRFPLTVKYSQDEDAVITKEYTYDYLLGNYTVPSNVREERIYRNNGLIGARRIDYSINKPIKIWNLELANPATNFQKFDGVNSSTLYKTNPNVVIGYTENYNKHQTVVDQTGIPKYFHWSTDENQLLMQVDNATDLAQIVHSSFENNPEGVFGDGWINSTAKTGTWAYQLSLQYISTKSLIKDSYNIEFWVKSSASNNIKISYGTSFNTTNLIPYKLVGTGTWVKCQAYIDKSSLSAFSTFAIYISGTGIIDELRIYPSHVRLTNYYYKTPNLVSAVVSPNADISHYEYDLNGRLINVKDQNGNILNEYQYEKNIDFFLPSSNLDFGSINTGLTLQKTFIIPNNGETTMEVTSVTYPSGFSGDFSSGSIAAHSAKTVTVTFSPTIIKTYSGPIVVNATGEGSSNLISVTGTGTGIPVRTISLSGSLNFYTVQTGTTEKRTIYVSNSGNSDLTITSVSLPVRYSASWKSRTIAPGASVPLTITFIPIMVGTYNGTLTITSDKTSGTNTMSVSGQGVLVDND